MAISIRKFLRRLGKIFLMLLATLVVMELLLAWLNRDQHTHCIRGLYLALAQFAHDHGGVFPRSDEGYAQALMQLVSEHYLEPRDLGLFAARGGDLRPFREALANHSVVRDEQASRVYVQGLRVGMNFEILLVFDKEPNIGDHFGTWPFGLWKEKVREVTDLGGGMAIYKAHDWDAVVSRQITLLRNEGFSDAEIGHFYNLTPKH